MSEAEQRHIVKGFHFELGKVEHKHIRELMVDHLNRISHRLAIDVAKGIDVKPPAEDKSRKYNKKSPALSQENLKTNLIKGRRVAILATEGVDKWQIDEIKKLLKAEGAVGKVVAKNLGKLTVKEGEIEVEINYLTTDSVMFDAVLVPGATDQSPHIEPDAIKFVQEAYRHCKPIAAIGTGIKLLQASGIEGKAFADQKSDHIKSELGVVTAGNSSDLKSFFSHFKDAIAQHRHWDREEKAI